MSGVVSLREARPDDCKRLFLWVNEATTRQQSFSVREVSWEEHRCWFEATLRDPRRELFIVTQADGEPIGQLRLDADAGGVAVISLSIDASRRGRGCGTEAIRLAMAELRGRNTPDAMHAYIKRDNQPSLRAFSRAGFAGPSVVDRDGESVLRMTLVLER